MLEHSVLLAPRGPLAAVSEQLAELYPALERLGAPFEVLLVDDGSSREEREALEELARDYPRLRLLWIDPASGASAALSAGIEAARGRHVIGIRGHYPATEIPRLLARLARADLAHGRRRKPWPARWWRAVRTLPERLLLGPEIRDPDCRFWAARREAVAGVALTPGMDRYLAWLVALGGYRVVEVGIRGGTSKHASFSGRGESRWGDLLSVWWQRRRRRSFTVTEVAPTASTQSDIAEEIATSEAA